jgi:hypothetical protein
MMIRQNFPSWTLFSAREAVVYGNIAMV